MYYVRTLLACHITAAELFKLSIKLQNDTGPFSKWCVPIAVNVSLYRSVTRKPRMLISHVTFPLYFRAESFHWIFFVNLEAVLFPALLSPVRRRTPRKKQDRCCRSGRSEAALLPSRNRAVPSKPTFLPVLRASISCFRGGSCDLLAASKISDSRNSRISSFLRTRAENSRQTKRSER